MDSTKTITHVGLCAGYGGIELGLKRVIPNLRTVALCEIEAFAIANLVAKMEAGLMDPAPIWPDLKTFPWQSFRDRVDILTGGYPCQPFSSAGKRAGKDDPRHLWPWIADGIASMRPSVCFFENVEGHISLGLSNVIEDLGRMGYRTTWGIFSATEVGAPHQRKRVFIMAHLFGSGLEGMLHDIAAQGREDAWRLASGCGKLGGEVWPSRPGEHQHGWEPPRVVGDSNCINRRLSSVGRVNDAEAGPAGQAVENSICGGGKEPSVQSADLSPESSWCDTENVGNTKIRKDNRREPGDMGITPSQGGSGNNASDASSKELGNTECIRRPTAHRDSAGMGSEECQKEGAESESGTASQAVDSADDGWRQTQPALGGNLDGTSGRMDYAKLCVSGDNRTDELRLLGNGVVPATAELAFRTLHASLAYDP